MKLGSGAIAASIYAGHMTASNTADQPIPALEASGTRKAEAGRGFEAGGKPTAVTHDGKTIAAL